MEPGDTLQYLPEHFPRHSHLSELEHQPALRKPPRILSGDPGHQSS